MAVVVGEAHRLLAHALAISLNLDAAMHVVAVQVEARPNVGRLSSLAPNVVLVDDVALVEQVCREPGTPAVLVLVASLEPETVYACALAGALGCITTQASPGKVIESIKAVSLGEVLFPPRILLDLVARSRVDPPPTIRRTASLAPREVEVLQTIVHFISASRSAAHLNISINTLRTHLKNALTKLEAESTLEAILIALKEGRIRLPT